MKVLDLFSGIGGFSLGLERAGMETVAFCEIEPYCQKVLAKHWPGVPIYDDVREVTGARLRADGIGRIDVITGGFPCQDISHANASAAGIEGSRSGLWGEIRRLIVEIRPQFTIVENVSALLVGGNGRWFGRVLGDLAEVGYHAEWHCIPATAVGGLHQRERIWIIAYPEEIGCIWPKYAESPFISERYWNRKAISITGGIARDKEQFLQKIRASEFIRGANGLPNLMDRISALGNAVVPQIPELIGRAILQAEKEMKSD